MSLKELFFERIMPLHQLYYEIEQTGIRVDFKRRAELQDMYLERWQTAQMELHSLVGFHVNVLSPKQVPALLFETLKLPKRTSCDEETLCALLGNHVRDAVNRKIIELILDIRGIRKTLGYLFSAPDYDGRMRSSYRIVGTETGRTSTGKYEPPVRPDSCGLAFQTLTKRGDAGSEIRSMLIPDEGYTFIEVDLSQAEARVVSLLSNDLDTLKLFDMADIHKLTAAVIFFNAPIEHIKPDVEQLKLVQSLVDRVEKNTHRFVGKTSRHAYNYDMKKRRLMLTVNTDARKYHIPIDPISEWFAGKIIDKLDKLMPNIKGVFHEEVKRVLSETRSLTNPFGRERFFMGRWEPELFREGFSQIPQSTITDHNKFTMLRVKKRIPGLQILMESHDAFLSQAKHDDVDWVAKIIKEEAETPINFSQCSLPRGEITIPCEIQISEKNYKDLRVYEVK